MGEQIATDLSKHQIPMSTIEYKDPNFRDGFVIVSYLITVLEAPLGGDDADIVKFLKEGCRHVHSVGRVGVQVTDLADYLSDFPGI